MPIFEFACKKCGLEFEELVYGSDDDVLCPKCNSKKIWRKVSAFAFKSSGKFVPSSGSSCSGCSPGPGGCSNCSH